MKHFVRTTAWRLVQAAAVGAFLIGPASAQMPGINLVPSTGKQPLTSEEAEKQKAREDAYKESLKKIPDQNTNKPADPWANMRASPPPSSAAKRQQR